MDAAVGTLPVILLSGGLLFLGFILGWLSSTKAAHSKIHRAEATAEQMIEDAAQEADSMKRTSVLEARDQMHEERIVFERKMEAAQEDVKRRQVELTSLDRQLEKRADLLNHKEETIHQRDEEMTTKEEAVQTERVALQEALQQQNVRLERIAQMSRQDAKLALIESLEEEARADASWRIKEIRDEALTRANDEAREIISNAIQRLASDHTVESTVASVKLPNEEMKGRIIGREGRNIRAFEMATGVDVIVDDTPEAVVLSGFDPIRRAVAKMTLEHLVSDGRIHPGRIEEVVRKSQDSIQEAIRESGEQAAYEIGVTRLNERLLEILGRLRFRTSYGQNILNHSKEVAHLTGMMATHLGLDAQLAKRAGLLHDIGKGLYQEAEGTVGEVGADQARKYGETDIVVNAIESHHKEADPASPIAVLVDAADSISRDRPGAQREVIENYVRRLQRLEDRASGIDGVEQVFAIQAGREVRVVANSEQMSDRDTERLAGEISKGLEKDTTFPGPVKVTVIRETRAVEFAR
ncbi:MAG: ribonuclease Y [Gemmatimonadetes bacterium]|nr:ribonuclease Y [Gemmatimonadota bacterium]|tara:strand:- start:1672 stop:3246 length:1575 start_codon:yes stop_codon:yes gene_type:complete